MKAISKGAEPASLAEHRQASPEDYDGYADKQALRDALVREQRGICCYCMGRIRNEHKRMKVEHWRCRDRYPADRLRYGNLLGACLGNEGQPPHLQHCDTSKKNKDLLWNPAEPAHQVEARIWYDGEGTIRSTDPAFDAELQSVLNLNLALLRKSRKETLDGIVTWWKLEKARLHGPVRRERLLRQRARLVGGDGDLAVFCQVAVWWLDQRLRQGAA